MMEKPNIRDMSREEIEALIAGLGKEKYRGRQIMKWLYGCGATSFAEMTTLAREFRLRIEGLTRIAEPALDRIQVSTDGTKKVLFRLVDGFFIESVLIPGRNHWTACISTQAGCAMGCRFCLTGRQGLKRNLLPSEITGQMTMLQRHTPEGPEIKNIVMMGMGEPLANYAHTLKAIRILTSDYGLGFSNRKITVSTCGIAPLIVQLGKDVCVNLAISLNAPDDRRRNDLMPINRKYPLGELLEACHGYPMPGRRMLTFEYILMAGVNDSPADADKLSRLLKGLHCKLNLIAFNQFPGSTYRTPTPEAVSAFQQILLDRHYTAILRASRGRDILAACGQLSGQAASGESLFRIPLQSPAENRKSCKRCREREHLHMGYRLLADFIVLLHGAFIFFAVLGWLLVLGSWRWAWLHLPAFFWAGFIELSGGICPLTPLENELRTLGGSAAYRGDFIDRYLIPLIYPEEMTRTVQITLGMFVILLNAGAYAALLYRSRRKSKG